MTVSNRLLLLVALHASRFELAHDDGKYDGKYDSSRLWLVIHRAQHHAGLVVGSHLQLTPMSIRENMNNLLRNVTVFDMRMRKQFLANKLAMSTENESRDSTADHGQAKANLDNLPTELVLKILPRVPDLASLDSFIRASPTAYRVFHRYAFEIMHFVLRSAYVKGHIRVMICLIALIRSGTLPIEGFHEFRERVILDSMRYTSRTQVSPTGFAPEWLDKETTPAVIRSILATARYINWGLSRMHRHLPRQVQDSQARASYRHGPQALKSEGPPVNNGLF